MVNELARAAWEDKSRVSYHWHNGKHDLVSDDWRESRGSATVIRSM